MGNSIFKKLFSSSLLMIVGFSVLIGVISYTIASRILIDETEKYRINELKQIDRSLLTVAEDVNQSTGILQNNKALNDTFGRSPKTSYQRYANASEVEKLLKSAMSNNDSILGFAVLSEFQDFSAGARSGCLHTTNWSGCRFTATSCAVCRTTNTNWSAPPTCSRTGSSRLQAADCPTPAT